MIKTTHVLEFPSIDFPGMLVSVMCYGEGHGHAMALARDITYYTITEEG